MRTGDLSDPRESRGFEALLAANLDQLKKRKHGISRAASRPLELEGLWQLTRYLAPCNEGSLIERRDSLTRVLGAATDAMQPSELGRATKALIGLNHSSAGSSLPYRRQEADREYGSSPPREADTIYRSLERPTLMPALLSGLMTLRRSDIRPGRKVADHHGALDVAQWEDANLELSVAVSRQDFDRAQELESNLRGALDTDLGPALLGSAALTHRLLGDLYRDKGHLGGPRGATSHYSRALTLETQMGRLRRIATIELMQAVLMEMSRDFSGALHAYGRLVTTPALREIDQAKAQLWIGTAKTKLGDATALHEIQAAMSKIERVGTEADWANAIQKLALGQKAAGRPAEGMRTLERLETPQNDPSPIQYVRLQLAQLDIRLATGEPSRSLSEPLFELLSYSQGHQLGNQSDAIRRVMRSAA